MVRRPPGPKSRLEDGLRHLVPLEGGTPIGRIRSAIRDPQEASPALRELAEVTEWIGGSPEDRAHWLWGLISEQILQLYDGERGQPEREAVRAAYGLAPWHECGTVGGAAPRTRLRLDRGGSCFFASEVTAQGEAPYVEEMVTSLGIAAGGLTMRIQFDRSAPPAAAWWYADASEARRLEPAQEGDPRRLTPSPFCYVEHTFAERCEPRGRYGVAWQWA